MTASGCATCSGCRKMHGCGSPCKPWRRRRRRAMRASPARSCAGSSPSPMRPGRGRKSDASSPGSRSAPWDATPATSSPISRAAAASTFMRKLYSARGRAENHIKAWKSPSRLGQNIVYERQRQPDAAHAARVRLLAVVDIAGGLSETLPMAARPVRHAAPPSGQAGGDHRREENPDRHAVNRLSN